MTTQTDAVSAARTIAANLTHLDDGTGTLRTIVESALKDGTISASMPAAKIEAAIAAIIAEAKADAAREAR